MKYGSFIIGCIAVVIAVICVLTSPAAAHWPGWLNRAHAILGMLAIIVFAIIAASWHMKALKLPPWQNYKEGDGDIMG